MAKFLIDVNLPRHFPLWNLPDYLHQSEIDPTWTDGQIWNYAEQHDLTIISKDADFSNRILLKSPPPKVIHIKFGNVKLKIFNQIIEDCWEQVLRMNETYKLVNVFSDRIQGVK